MKRAKVLSLFLAGTLLFHTAGIDALATTAADPVSVSESVEEPEEESSEEISGEEDSEQSSSEDDEKDKENEENSGNEEGSEDEENSENEENPDDQETVEDEELSEDEENSEYTVSENTISENTLPEDEESIFDIFPGLGDDYTFSAQQLDSKRELAAHVGDIVKVDVKNAVSFPDAEGLYALGEVVYLAETEEEAEKVAKAFGGTLDSYSYEVAVISLPEQATVAMAIVAAADPDFKLPAVWPNYYYYLDSDIDAATAASAPADPGFADQWQHDYIGTRYAWAAGFKGQGIKVAVIDSGLKRGHDDLSANAEAGRTFVDGAAGTEFNGDNLEHGTHVAGIIAAVANNGKGGVGIAPEAKVRGYAVFNSAEETETAYITRAINAAVKDGNDIINMSIGGPMYDGTYAETVMKAYKENGVAIFASSGNADSSANNFPAAYPGAISVGAVDQNSAKASFSNYGSTVKLSFPGVHIYSTIPSGYGYMSGTSQASPAAAGTAAVILSAREDIKNKSGKARVDALLAAMKSSTTKCTTSGMGAGTTWLPGALKIATDMTAPDAPTITIEEEASDKAGKTYIAEEVTVSLSTKTAVGVEIYYTYDGKSPSYKNGQIVVGTKYNGTSFKVGGAKNKTIKAIAVNPLTGKVSKVASKACVLTPNPNGVVVKPVDGVTRIAPGKSLKFTATVTPSYAISTKVIWSVDPKAAEEGITVSNGTVKTVNSKTKITAKGTYTVTATAVDKNNKPFTDSKSGSYTFTVDDTLKSVNKIAFVDGTKAYKPSPLNTGAELNLAQYLIVTYQDKTDGSAADVVWSSNNVNVATVDSNGKITAKEPGKAVIKAISNDGSNKSASCNITVNQPITEITISDSNPKKVAAGKSITLTATVKPGNATNKKLDWKVAENGQVTVNASGKLTAKKDATGTCKVTAAAKDGSDIVSAAYTVTIISGEITNITLDQKTVTLFPPNTSAVAAKTKTKLNATVTGKDSADKTLITWTSSAPSIASVDPQGNVNAISAGKATITCAAIDGSNKKATCTVNVTIPMSKLSIGPADGFGDYYTKTATSNFEGYGGYIAAGKSIKMSAQYTSNYGVPTNKKVTWTSSNPDLLKVDKNGKVTAKKLDYTSNEIRTSAVITATAADGSGVVSNKYTFTVMPLIQVLLIDEDNGVKGIIGYDEEEKAFLVIYPDYFTTTVSGGKNPGLSKGVKDKKFYTVLPVPGQVTTKKPSNDPMGYYKSDTLNMTVTVKLRDGSNVSAKRSWNMIRFSDGKWGSIKFRK